MSYSSKLSFILHPSSFILLELLSEGQCIVKYESSRHLCDDSRLDSQHPELRTYFSRQPCTVHDAAAASHAWIAWYLVPDSQVLDWPWALLLADVHVLAGMIDPLGLKMVWPVLISGCHSLQKCLHPVLTASGQQSATHLMPPWTNPFPATLE